MVNIVFVSGHYPSDVYFAQKTKELLQKYTEKHNYGFFYHDEEVKETYRSSLHFLRCLTLSNAAKKFPAAKWFVWLDSDIAINPKNEHLSLESQLDLTDENILYHVCHEAPWGCYQINSGVKVVNRRAIKYEEEIWDLRNTSPWNTYPYEQKTLFEYIFPKLQKNEYIIHDPYILNCIVQAYPDKVENSLFIHMCAMHTTTRNRYIKNLLKKSINNMKKHITIITYCTGYSYEVYERFTGTLYDTGFKGDLILIIKEEDKSKIDKLMETYKNVSYYLDKVDNNMQAREKRYFIFQEMFKSLELQTDYILLCDTDDIYFQKNIELFPIDPSIDIFFFEEDVNISNGVSIKNSQENKKAISSGAIFGKKNGIETYVDKMCRLMTTQIDKIMQNYLIYCEGIPDITVDFLKNSDNLVNNLQGASFRFINGSNHIINSEKEPSYIVQKWGTLPEYMTSRISARYAKYNFNDK